MADKHTTREAAKLIGVSRQTLQAWCKEGYIKAPKPTRIGAISVRLWTEAQIKEANDFKGRLWPGPYKKRPRNLRFVRYGEGKGRKKA